MDVATKAMLARMPLAEAVLWLWRWITGEERMAAAVGSAPGTVLSEGISFSVIVQVDGRRVVAVWWQRTA